MACVHRGYCECMYVYMMCGKLNIRSSFLRIENETKMVCAVAHIEIISVLRKSSTDARQPHCHVMFFFFIYFLYLLQFLLFSFCGKRSAKTKKCWKLDYEPRSIDKRTFNQYLCVLDIPVK